MRSSEDHPLPLPESTDVKSFFLGIDLDFLMIHKLIALVGSSKFLYPFRRSLHLMCLSGGTCGKASLEVAQA
jgi:hypothetical protein